MTETASEVRVRFAPSPTGRLHIGGARTAIYNWAFARANGGKFILRIEDTDPERSTDENTQVILRAMRWLGLDWDEGPEVGGPYGPYFQMQRLDTYREALEQLKAAGAAYPCFCTKEELDAKRAAAKAENGGYDGYDRTCRHLDPAEAEARIAAGEPHVWRLAVPENHGPIEFDDAAFGHTSFPGDFVDDFILVRTDGSPTYNFACVVDDSNMAITHVVRGADHLNNTPKQILIYEALGKPVPKFAHLSMILGGDGQKLSKRHGATSVEEYRDHGFLPDTMVNFLALLGWSLDGDTTIIPRDVLCEKFSLDRITKKNAIFDEKKLDWMNGMYIREMGADAFAQLATNWVAEARALGRSIEPGVHVVPTANPSDPNAPQPEPIVVTEEARAEAATWAAENPGFAADIYPILAERLNRMEELPEKIAYMFWGTNARLDQKSVTKSLLKEGARAQEALAACRAVLADESLAWDKDTLEGACRAKGEEMGLKPKLLFAPLRVAVSGNMVSPPLFESIVLMDRAQVLARIDAVAQEVFGA